MHGWLRYTLAWVSCCTLLLGCVVAPWDGRPQPEQVHYNAPDGRSLAAGKRELERLQKSAQDEGFLDVLLGSNCYSSAVRSVQQDCNQMDSDSSMWLAFSMANCLFAKSGRQTYPCKISTFTSCIGKMNGDDYIVFSQFLQNIHAMCVFVANADFQHRAECMLNDLVATGFVASEQVTMVQRAVEQQAAVVEDLGSGIDSVAAGQKQVMEGVSESMVAMTQLHEVASNMEQGMRESQAMHQELLESEKNVANKLSVLEALHSEHTEAVRKTWQMIEDQARWYMEWQGDSLALHSRITESAAAMAHASEGIRTATNFFESAQHRSQNALAVLVGRQFSRSDVLFVTGSFIVFVAMGWHHATQQKRLAFLLSLLLTIGLERAIITWLEPWQRLGADGAAWLEPPKYLTWMVRWCGTPTVEQLKSFVRISAAFGNVVVLLRAVWVHQDASQMLQQVLDRINQLEHEQTAKWHLLQSQFLLMLQNVRDAGTSMPEEHPQTQRADRRMQEQLRIEQLRQEAIAERQPGPAWNAVTSPVVFPNSSPLPHMDTLTPFYDTSMHANKAGIAADSMPREKRDTSRTVADDLVVQSVKGNKRKAVCASTDAAAKTAGKTGSQKQVPRRTFDEKPARQKDGASRETRAPTMQQMGGSKKLKVQVMKAKGADAEHQTTDESARKSPRFSKCAVKRMGERDDDEQEATRTEKKLKAALDTTEVSFGKTSNE